MAWSRALLSVTAMDVCAEPETEYPSSYRLIPRLAGQGFWFVCLRWSICLMNRKRWYQVLQHLASSMSRRLVDFFWHPRCNFTIIDVNVLPWGAKMRRMDRRFNQGGWYVACMLNLFIYNLLKQYMVCMTIVVLDFSWQKTLMPDLPASLMEKYAAAAGNHSKKPCTQWNQSPKFSCVPFVW